MGNSVSLTDKQRKSLRMQVSNFADHEDVDGLMDYVEAELLYGKDEEGMREELSDILGDSTDYFVTQLFALVNEVIQQHANPIQDQDQGLKSSDDEIRGKPISQSSENNVLSHFNSDPILTSHQSHLDSILTDSNPLQSLKSSHPPNLNFSFTNPKDELISETTDFSSDILPEKQKLMAEVESRLRALHKKKNDSYHGQSPCLASDSEKIIFKKSKPSSNERFNAISRNPYPNPSKSSLNENTYHTSRSQHDHQYTNDRSYLSNKKKNISIEGDHEDQNISNWHQYHDSKKNLIRCKYFPSCTNSHCPYFHPTEPCPNFPYCNFGASCIYIHPDIPCKFGMYCTRGNECPFTHPSLSRSKYQTPYMSGAGGSGNLLIPSGSIHGLAPCKNGFSCTTLRCPFSHPLEMCKYGNACKNHYCQYSHSRICRNGRNCSHSGCPFAHTNESNSSNSSKPTIQLDRNDQLIELNSGTGDGEGNGSPEGNREGERGEKEGEEVNYSPNASEVGGQNISDSTNISNSISFNTM